MIAVFTFAVRKHCPILLPDLINLIHCIEFYQGLLMPVNTFTELLYSCNRVEKEAINIHKRKEIRSQLFGFSARASVKRKIPGEGTGRKVRNSPHPVSSLIAHMNIAADRAQNQFTSLVSVGIGAGFQVSLAQIPVMNRHIAGNGS